MAASTTNLQCGICSKPYSKATMLECVHSFCRSCVESLIKDSKDNKILCPTCTSPSKVSSNGVDGFASNIHLDNQVEIASIRMKEDLQCQRCRRKGDRKAIEFCKQCNRRLCKACVENHEVDIDYEDHERISIDEFKSGDIKIELPPGKCLTHNEKFRWYCSVHKNMLCETCRIEEHSKCDVAGFNKAATTEKADLAKELPLLKPISSKLGASAKAVEDMKTKVEATRDKVDQEIDSTFDKLKQAMEERRAVLKKRCTDIAQMKSTILTEQLNDVNKLKEAFDFVEEQITNSTTEHSLEELLSVKEVTKKRAQVIRNSFDSNWQIKENDVFDVLFDEMEDISKRLSTFGFFSQIPEPANCSVEGIGIPEAVVGFKREFQVTFKNEKNEVIKGNAMFQYTLEQKEEGAPKPDVTIAPANGMSTLAITPKAIGELTLTIKVNNTTLRKFPFHIKVRHPRDYTKLPGPTTINLSSTGGSAITFNDGHLYVTTQNVVEVHKPDSNGTPVITHNKSLSNPCGVAVVENNVYIVNRGTNEVRVYAKAGEFVRSIGKYGSGDEEFNNPYGICSEGNERILVADCGNSRVQVYTRTKAAWSVVKEDFFCSIPCPSANPIDVAVDASGKVYVALQSTNQIEIFSWNGNNYQSINKYNVGGAPYSIFVDVAGYRFVTRNNNTLLIYDPSGKEIVTQTGLGYVGSVTADSNGTLYVSVTNGSYFYKL